MSQGTQYSTTYFVLVDKTTGVCMIDCIGLGCVDAPHTGTYASVDELPDIFRKRIAVLSMLEHSNDEVSGVGQRFDESTYWVHI